MLPQRRVYESDMPIPDYQALMLPLLKRAALGEVRVLDAEKELGKEFGLTPEERAQLLPSGKQRVLHNRAHWAKFYLMKAGLVTFPRRGTFVATNTGQELIARDPSHIDLDLLREYPSFEEFYGGDHATPADRPLCSHSRLPGQHQPQKSKSRRRFGRLALRFVSNCYNVFCKTHRHSLRN